MDGAAENLCVIHEGTKMLKAQFNHPKTCFWSTWCSTILFFTLPLELWLSLVYNRQGRVCWCGKVLYISNPNMHYFLAASGPQKVWNPPFAAGSILESHLFRTLLVCFLEGIASSYIKLYSLITFDPLNPRPLPGFSEFCVSRMQGLDSWQIHPSTLDDLLSF